VIKIKLRFVGVFLFLVVGCDHMDTIIKLMDQVSEKCEVISDPALYKKFDVDPHKEIIVHYSLFLEKQKRSYLSDCGTYVSKKVSRHLHSWDFEEGNPISRETYMTISPDTPSVDYYFLCGAGGFYSVVATVKGSPRKMVFSKKNGEMTCEISMDKSIKPEILEGRGRDGRFPFERE